MYCDQETLWPDAPFQTPYLLTHSGGQLGLLDHYRWALVKAMRYAKPTLLGDCVENCRRVMVQGASSHAIAHKMEHLSSAEAMKIHAKKDP